MMKVFLFLVCALLMSAPVMAQQRCAETERFGQRLIRVGDSERRVFEVAGEPDRERQLETRQGGAAGIRMDYYLHDRTVQIYIQGGQVSRICRFRE